MQPRTFLVTGTTCDSRPETPRSQTTYALGLRSAAYPKPWIRTSENTLSAKFAERPFHALR